MAKNSKKPHRSRTPESSAFHAYMGTGWAAHAPATTLPAEVATFSARRREALIAQAGDLSEGALLVIPAGGPKQRSNDTDYPYRPHSAFSYLTGWGATTTPGSVLVVDLQESTTTLYARGPAGRDTDEFYASAELGEFWTGPRPHLDEIARTLGITVTELGQWPGITEADLPRAVILEDGDWSTTTELRHRREARLDSTTAQALREADETLGRILSEARFVKDDWEIAQMRQAIDATARGFRDIIQALPRTIGHARGERIVEGVFAARARLEGNEVGYGTIAASGPHACILHWVRNDGPVREGDLVLVDAGVELDSLYTADITRTIPVNGEFSPEQRLVYDAVLEAADAALAAVKPGVPFRAIHDAAMDVIARKVDEFGFLPVSVEEALSSSGGQHRRYMIHGTSHHLGLDVHDCAKARRELYVDQEIQPGMVFTIEPGLYFQPDDLTVPEVWRGIGVRIEDNILVTQTGGENMSAFIPRTASEVEAWVKDLSL